MWVEHVTPGMKLDLCSMIVIGCPHRSDDGEIVDLFSDIRKPVAYSGSTLPVLFVSDLERVEFVSLLSIGIAYHHDPLVGELFRIKNRGVGGLGNRFAGVFIECGFRIEAFHVANPAPHEEPDHALGFSLGGNSWTGQHVVECKSPKAKTGSLKELSAIVGVK
jgi:hypothetical protein